MLRDLMVHAKTCVNGYCQSDSAMETGKAVIKTSTGFAYPSSATSAELFFVQKARIPIGINAARNEFSDYNANFTGIANDEYITATKYGVGDIFSTDAIATIAPRTGYAVMANTDGDLVYATSASKYLCESVYDENGHTALKISVLDTAKTNSTVRTVTITEPTNGEVSVSSTYSYYIVGDVVTIAYTPAEGYELDAITVEDSSSGAVTVTDNQFTMPDKNVTVTVTFKLSA